MKIGTKQIIEIAGGLAVVLSLLLVAYEIRQTNQISNATIMYDLLNDYSVHDQAIFENENAAALLSKLREPDVELTKIEYERARGLTFRYMNIWGAQEFAYANDQVPEEHFQVVLTEIESVLRDFPGIRPIFRDTLNFNPSVAYLEFVDVLEQQLQKYGN